MVDIIDVTIFDETTPISKAGFGLGLIFDDGNDIDYKEIESTSDLTNVSSGDPLYDMVEQYFAQEPSPSEVAVYGVDIEASGTSISEELDKLEPEGNDDWYFLMITSRTEADLEEAAGWASSNGKLFIGQYDVSTSVSAINTSIETISSSRAAACAHDGGTEEEEQYMDASFTGRMSVTDPGSSTWMFKALNGVAPVTYTNTDINSLLDAEDGGPANTYITKYATDMTLEGKTTDGGYIDIQRSKDWLKSRIKEEIFFLLSGPGKTPLDDIGISQVVGKLKDVLQRAASQGIIARDADGNALWSVSYPTRDEISDVNLADRILPDIEFTATVAGAVHSVEIEGTLTV